MKGFTLFGSQFSKALAPLMLVFAVALFTGCSKEEGSTQHADLTVDPSDAYEADDMGGEAAAPSHATGQTLDEVGKLAHANLAGVKEVKLADEVASKWTKAEVDVSDVGIIEHLALNVGDTATLKSGLTLELISLVPDYSIFEDYISSRSNEANNPAVLLSLKDGDREVARGWIFESLPGFNSFKHVSVEVVLTSPSSSK